MPKLPKVKRATRPPSPKPQRARYLSPSHLPRGDHKPDAYLVTRSERYVFGTDPYSAHIKTMWRFKNEQEARTSAGKIYECFKQYSQMGDFVGMDVCRKFIQMGRTRSMRYALRPGGKKYTTDESGEKSEMKRTGKVYDEEKLKGAEVFKEHEQRCWQDPEYTRLWEEWGGKSDKVKKEPPSGT